MSISWKRQARLAWLLTLGMACAAPPRRPDPHDAEIATLKRQVAAVQQSQHEDRTVLFEMLAETLCPNVRVRSFFQSCTTLGTDTCPLSDLSDILGEMSTLDHVMIYYYPGVDASNPADERRAMIKNLVRRHVRRPTTRLLVVALPASIPAKFAASVRIEVGEMARSLRRLVGEFYVAERRETHLKEAPLPMLPATAITCNQAEAVLRPFLRIPDNRPLPREPQRGQPQVIIWAFLVDC